MPRQLLNQYNMLALFDRDRSNWEDLRHYPDTVTCRRMLRFADWAAKFPKHYETARRVYEAPELSLREVAIFAGIPWTTFRERMAVTTQIDDPNDFSFKELDYNDLPEPAIPCRTGRTGRTGRTETYQNAIALADFAHEDPVRWQVIRAYYGECPPSQKELACLYRISQATVSRYIESIKHINNIKNINNDLTRSYETHSPSGRALE